MAPSSRASVVASVVTVPAQTPAIEMLLVHGQVSLLTDGSSNSVVQLARTA